jgi:hypothetical protein
MLDMRRRTLLSQGSIALLSLVALSTSANAQSSDLTGDWQVTSTGDQFKSGTVHLQQSGSAIVGSYTGDGAGAHVSGKLTNHVMSGTWKGANGNESGWVTIFFRESGNGFNGEWGYHGRPPNGLLVGTKK